jgi:hypothetical protein
MVAGPGGTVTPPSGDYLQGSVIKIEALPESGYVFDRWTGVGAGSYSGGAPVNWISMNGPITQAASFQPLDNLTMSADSGGTVYPSYHQG